MRLFPPVLLKKASFLKSSFCDRRYKGGVFAVIYEDGEMPYKKKAKRKSVPKARHKHEYSPCVFEYDSIRLDDIHGIVPTPAVSIGMYCPVCGKVGSLECSAWMRWVPANKGGAGRSEYTEIAKRELNPSTRMLPSFRLDNGPFQKYVRLEGAYGPCD